MSRFECFDLNGFEQLCKNYAVEKIRGKFLQDEVYSGGAEDIKDGRSLARNATGAACEFANHYKLMAMFEGKSGEGEMKHGRRAHLPSLFMCVQGERISTLRTQNGLLCSSFGGNSGCFNSVASTTQKGGWWVSMRGPQTRGVRDALLLRRHRAKRGV